jgi:hypothetical protein
MAIVSMTLAKHHLRIPIDDTDRDADIAIKLDQAIAIVLDYLKVRLTAIVSVSVASPAVITTAVPHSLTSGATSTLAGTTTTPTVNGPQVITVTGPTTFTVPVAVTIGQTDAAGTVATPTWTELTLPGHLQAAILIVLAHLYEHREDMTADADVWGAVERLLRRARDPALV